MPRVLLIALDSVGIDPLGHDRPESVYSQSRFLFPKQTGAGPLTLPDAPVPGVLVETAVAGPEHRGAIECAITYTSIFSGQSAVDRHGLMSGLGLKEAALQDMVRKDDLFRHFENPCLANAIFPLHLPFLGGSFVEDLVPAVSREEVEARLRLDGEPVRLRGTPKHGFAELFTLGEINQNIFVFAAREAGVSLLSWDDVREGRALTGTMTHELEGRINWDALGLTPLPRWDAKRAAAVLLDLVGRHDFTFYKYQLADLVSHTDRVDLARGVFAEIEAFVEPVLRGIDSETVVIVTSDHGHLEQVAYSHGHPKSAVPTWYFGPGGADQADDVRRPEGIFRAVTRLAPAPRKGQRPSLPGELSPRPRQE